VTLTTNTTTTANFNPQYTLTLTPSPGSGGAVKANPGGGVYLSGTKVCLTAAAAAGWQFVAWSGATLDTANCLTMTANATVAATFTPVYMLTVNASPAGGGSAATNPAGNTYVSGTKVCLTATAAAGWQFAGWSGAALDAANCLTMTANAAVTANFVHVYTLSLDASPDSGGT